MSMTPERLEAEAAVAAAEAHRYNMLAAWVAKWIEDGGTRPDFVSRLKGQHAELNVPEEVNRNTWIMLDMIWPEEP